MTLGLHNRIGMAFLIQNKCFLCLGALILIFDNLVMSDKPCELVSMVSGGISRG